MKSLIKRFAANDFLKNVATLVSATGIAQAISLLIYPVLTRIYLPSEHGLFSLFMTVITITAIVATGKYEMGIMIPKKEKDGAGLTVLSIILGFLFSLFLFFFILIFKKQIPSWLGNELIDKWLLFIPLSTFLIAIFQTLSFWYNRKSKYRIIAGANLGQSLINSAVKLSASKLLSQGGGLMTGAIVGQVAGAVIYTWKIARDGIGEFLAVSRRELKELARRYWYFPRYNMFHKLINNFSSSLPVFVFSHYFSADIVGFFGLGFMLINRPMNLLSTSITKVFSQQTIKSYNQGHKIHGELKKFSLRMAAVAAVPFLIVLVAAPFLVSLIFGEDWVEAGVYMRIFVPWLFFVFISTPLSFIADMLSRQRKAMNIEIVKFILRVLALGIGVRMQNVLLALSLFSAVSTLVVIYNLWWYFQLAKQADKSDRNSREGDRNE